MRSINIIIALLFTFSVICFSGCVKIGTDKKDWKDKSEATSEIDYWIPYNYKIDLISDEIGNIEFYRELEKQLGVDINFIKSKSRQFEEEFELMVSSDTLPDIFEYDINYYRGGVQKALDDEIIIPLNDKLQQYAPNFSKLIAENPRVDKDVKTDDGIYYTFPFVRETDSLRVYSGLMLRGDWLSELGLSVPETIDEWENVLLQFKNVMGASAPLTFKKERLENDNVIAGAFRTSHGMYLDDDDRVKYGPVTPEFRSYLATMNRWFNLGIIDSSFISNDDVVLLQKIKTGKSGAAVGGVGGVMSKLLDEMEGKNPSFSLVPAKYPVLTKGDVPMLGQLDPVAMPKAFISSNCRDVSLAMKILDYGYSEEGNLLFNFGTEGKTYTVVDGIPTYTDEIEKNPDGLDMISALSKYTRAVYNGPFVQMTEYNDQINKRQAQKDAVEKWADTDADRHVIPYAISFTTDEASKYVSVMTNVEEYASDMVMKFILGNVSLDEFDSYVEKVYSMGIEEAVNICQNAVNRYKLR